MWACSLAQINKFLYRLKRLSLRDSLRIVTPVLCSSIILTFKGIRRHLTASFHLFEAVLDNLCSEYVRVVVNKVLEYGLDCLDLLIQEVLPVLVLSHLYVLSHVVVLDQIYNISVLNCRSVHTGLRSSHFRDVHCRRCSCRD